MDGWEHKDPWPVRDMLQVRAVHTKTRIYPFIEDIEAQQKSLCKGGKLVTFSFIVLFQTFRILWFSNNNKHKLHITISQHKDQN